MDGLTLGRIVHFVADRGRDFDFDHRCKFKTAKCQHVAAMVTGINPDIEGAVHLSVNYPGVSQPESRINVPYDPTGETPGSWHWVEKA